MKAIIKSWYNEEDWDFFDNHPNLIGATARAMIDIYVRNWTNPDNEDALSSVIFNRKMAGQAINYAGGDNTKFLDLDKIKSLIEYAEKDLCTIIYAMQFIESEIFRLGISTDLNTKEIICDVIIANVIEYSRGKALIPDRKITLFKISTFEHNWYNSNFT